MTSNDAKGKMQKTILSLEEDFKTLRTGRANPAILDKIRVEQYSQSMPINQLAAVSVPDARSIVIKPWDRASLKVIEKAILAANIGLVPITDEKIIRITIPPLSSERRIELTKLAKQISEQHKVAIRNIRRHLNESLHSQQQKAEISEDEEHRLMTQIDKETETYITTINTLLAKKEKEIMED